MREMTDTSGDAQIVQMLQFAGSAFRASGVVFYWVNETIDMYGFQGRGVPDGFLDRYQAEMNRHDPLLARRLATKQRRVAWLREEAPPLPEAPAYIEFLDDHDIIDNLEFVFWDGTAPFAGLGVLRNRDDPPLETSTMDLAAIHKYFEFNTLLHPRQREARLRAMLGQRFQLTRREIEAVSLLCAGASNHDIAEAMGLQIATVKTHIVNILNKLGVDNRSAVVGLVLSVQ